MYNIMTTCNHQYHEFGHILLNSIIDKCNIDKINKIFVGDVGLSEIDKKALSAISDLVSVVDTPLKHKSSVPTHSREWVELVSFKTAMLRQIVQDERHPVIMLDVDQVVMEDFIPSEVDRTPVTVCARKNAAFRGDGMRLDYIASFFVANNKAAIDVIDEWRAAIELRIAERLVPGYETPALCQILGGKVLGKDFVSVIDEEYSSPNVYVKGKTKILHCKSEGPHSGEGMLKQRMSRVVGMDDDIHDRLGKYQSSIL